MTKEQYWNLKEIFMLPVNDMALKTSYTILFCWLMATATGQNPASCHCDSILEKLMEPRLTGENYIKPVPSSVSQFFTDDWLLGTIHLTNDLTVENQYFRYNGYIDHLIWMDVDFRQIRLDNDPIRSFCLADKYITGKSYCFEKIKIPKDLASDSMLVFAQVLYKNTLSLFVQRKVVLTGIEERKQDRIIVDSYEKRNIYYFKSGEKITDGFRKITKKSILNTFPGRKEDIIKLYRSGRQFRVRSEEDLIRFTARLNEINAPYPQTR
jgi:hypothetical protein